MLCQPDPPDTHRGLMGHVIKSPLSTDRGSERERDRERERERGRERGREGGERERDRERERDHHSPIDPPAGVISPLCVMESKM